MKRNITDVFFFISFPQKFCFWYLTCLTYLQNSKLPPNTLLCVTVHYLHEFHNVCQDSKLVLRTSCAVLIVKWCSGGAGLKFWKQTRKMFDSGILHLPYIFRQRVSRISWDTSCNSFLFLYVRYPQTLQKRGSALCKWSNEVH